MKLSILATARLSKCFSSLTFFMTRRTIGKALITVLLASPLFAYAEHQEQCPVVYVDGNLKGSSYNLCLGGKKETSYTHQIPDDAISSIFIAPDSSLAVEACEHADGSGRCRTYFKTVRYVGDEFNNRFSFFRVVQFSYDDFFKVISSDPQYPWSCGPKGGSCNNTTQADLDNTKQVDSMNAIQKTYGKSHVAGSIINGDLTAYGHDWQLAKYFQFYERDLKMNNYPGLGNHDYANNVNDTYQNYGATRMMEYLVNSVNTLNVHSFDYSDSGSYSRYRENSFGYSWDVGNVHFVQLNNYPTYSTSWNGWNFNRARRDYFNIRSSLSWLRNDLSQAYSKGKKIILNFHDWGNHSNTSDAEFVQILKDFKVAAIFAGHIHSSIGKASQYSDLHGAGRHLPVFRSGAAVYNDYLLARFLKNDMIVSRVDSSYGSDYRLSTVGVYPLQAGALQGEWYESGGRSSKDAANPRVQLTLKEATTVRLDLISAIDTYIYLLDSSGDLIGGDDDSGDGLNSRLSVQLSAGTYTIVAATFGKEKFGEFVVRSSAGDLAFTEIADNWRNSGGRKLLAPGNLSYVYRAPTYSTTVTFDLISDADSYLYLTDLDGKVIASDDDSGGDYNARITAQITGGQPYLVTAATYNPEENSSFKLKASAGTLQ